MVGTFDGLFDEVVTVVTGFTRANNSNGALRTITIDQQHPPSTGGLFPVQ